MTVITKVDNLLYGGRTLVGYTDEGERIAGWPEVAYEAIRAINHLTGHGPIPAPTLYRILGDLKRVGHLLPQALDQLGRGLRLSLTVLDVYDHRRDPAESVEDAEHGAERRHAAAASRDAASRAAARRRSPARAA